ncbi:MAG TPA: DNA polymerase Y family protein [Thermoanaerobaculia bacterium]|jgi:protein ImuB|nr:DNA polymerase Y family protein [Thermoanaerobaculia bacterium]
MPPRVACIVVPLFPLAARLRSEPELAGEAVAVFEGNGNAARVVAATRPARRAGIQAGQTLPQARALLPDLLARGRDRESERAAGEALAEVAETFSPRVESAGEGVVYFDAAGIPIPPLPPGEGRGEGAESAEKRLGRAVIAAVEKAGLPARFGIAASKLASRIAAGLPESPTVVAEGEEARFLAPLPLAKLAPQMELGETLERWGIRSIGELAKLPEGEVASRLGELGRELHATARGVDPRPLEPRLPSPSLSEGMELEWPLVSLEPFLFVGNAALERLVRRLESQALACRRLEVGLQLDPEGWDARAITLPAPTRDTKTLLTLVRLELEARPPGAPVVGFIFTAQPDRTRQAQLSLFGPAALSPDRLATTIARLVALLGADRVGSPRAVNGHRPERLTVADYSPPPPPAEHRVPRTGRGLLAIRVLRPAVELEVIVSPCHPEPASCHPERSEGSLPFSRLLSLKSTNGSDPEISGTVRVAAGPWNLEDGWWSAAPASRDYWDVELSEGGLYRIYRDRRKEKWYADGMYD